jgi:hypothetical protein
VGLRSGVPHSGIRLEETYLAILLSNTIALIDQQPHGVLAILGFKKLINVVGTLRDGEDVCSLFRIFLLPQTHDLS